MDTNRLLDAGERGTHLLFEPEAIAEAFRHDLAVLRAIVARRGEEIQRAVEELVAIQKLERARSFVASLPAEVRHVLVVLYFELLEGRLRARASTH